jgi:hypothetical protein
MIGRPNSLMEAKFFPDMVRKFPAQPLREFCSNPGGISGFLAVPDSANSTRNCRIPCFFPDKQGIGLETSSLKTGPSATLSD